MKPLNYDNSPCSPISSNCVIWQGPDIPCIKLCAGDTISDVIFKLATELCAVLDTLNVTNYDLSCFNLTACGPNDFQALIQFLIEQICATETQVTIISDPATSPVNTTKSDPLITVAPCFVINGITVMTVSQYAQAIGTRVCDLVTQIAALNSQITSLDIRVTALEAAIKPTTILIAIMYANNEIGVVQPVKEITAIAKKHGVLFFSDAVQAVGKIPVDVNADGIDIMAFTAHKMYGPKGIGALYVRRKNPRVKVTAQMDGGGHERGMRSGTLNVPGIVGFGKACELARLEMAADAERLSKLRDKLEAALTQIDESYVNGSTEHRLPHVANISFKYVEGEGLMMGFNKTIALSSGSACTSASLEPSYVLKALGLGDDLAHSSLRFGLGRFTTDEQIDYTIKAVTDTVLKLREMSPLWEMFKEGIDLDSIEWAHH